MQILEVNNGETRGSRIILLTDGDETTEPYVRDVEERIIEAGIIVYSLLLSESADETVITLASKTGEH